MMAGQLIAGRYEVEGRLGTGGMSTVELALDRNLQRRVAVKLLAEHLAEDEAFVSRFRREALAAARLVHPNIVQVFDFGLDDASDRHYIVMEYVRGRSCAQLLRDQGQLGIDEAVDVIQQACRGLDHAHRNGVVHRDVKPGNLLRSDDGVVKLADFGIAKATEQTNITQAGSVLGTAAYLAPEQAHGEPAGPASDIYSLGVVAYQLLSNRLPYEATSLTELAMKQQSDAPTPLEELNPDVPTALAHAIERALAIAPEDRYASALEMGEALAAGARGVEPQRARRRGAGGPATAATQMLADRDDKTAATQMLGERSAAEATEMLPSDRRQPRVPRAPRQPTQPRSPRAMPATSQPRKKRRRARRALGLLVLVLVLLAIGIAAIAVADSRSRNPQLRNNFGDTVSQAIDDVKQLIDDNTR